jgi:hypothetical protein
MIQTTVLNRQDTEIRTSFDADQTFAEEIRRMTGEGIETLRFVGDKIISQGRGRERERELIHFCSW